MRILGYDPDSTDQSVQGKVRISGPLGEMGSPNWSRTEDTVFIRVTQLLDNYSELWDITYGGTDFDGSVSNHEAYEVSWVVYGLNALETAQKVRYGLLRETIRQELIGAGIAFKPEIRMPNYVPEQDRSGDWWNRYDLQAQMYLKQTRKYAEEYIDKPPVISVSFVEWPGFVLNCDRLNVDKLQNVITQTT